ncbi:hypothetical protein ILUMI_22029 [Ignelater luminosus]|uniref:Uncharacterized protein n=1 Tax=Ignelater luminosus TaxID=2038154 RepID=A0A8K0CHU8_IGNLU|nr:hypothetical protein ILUMI_22029 [Ignelater luminosus]
MQESLRRHSDVPIRTPEATSGVCAMGFNWVAVDRFFKLLIKTVEKYYLTANKSYNADKTGIMVNPKGLCKILATKGKQQVIVITSGERGETVTVEIYADFLPSTTTHIQTIKVQRIPEETKAISVNPKIEMTTPELESELFFDISKQGPSNDHETSSKFVSSKAIIPVPKIGDTTKRISRKTWKTAISTAFPYKTNLESHTKPSKKKAVPSTSARKRDSSSDSETSNAGCFYCGDSYSSSTEGWIACTMCLRWAHKCWVCIENDDDEAVLYCEHCK